jgi:hypothetical protein
VANLLDDLIKGGGQAVQPETPASPIADLLQTTPEPAVLDQAVRANPDEEAKIRKEAAVAGVEPDVVRASPDEARTANRVNALDGLLKDAPVTSSFMRNPTYARVAHDDVERLTAWEKISRGFQHGVAINERGRAGLGLRATPQSAEARAQLDAINERLKGLGHSTDGFIGFLTGTAEVLGQMAESFSQPQASLNVAGGGAIGAAIGAAGGPLAPATASIGALAGMGAGLVSHRAADVMRVEAGNHYADAIEMGIDPEVAHWTSLGVGVVNMGFELASDMLMVKPLTKAARTLFKQSAREAFQRKAVLEMAQDFASAYGIGLGAEIGTEMLQEISGMIGEEIGKALSDGDFENLTLEEATDRLEEIAIKTFKSTALLAGVGPSVRLGVDLSEARKATKAREHMEKLHAEAQQSKLVERDPELAAEHGGAALREVGIDRVYVAADKLVEYAEKTGDAYAVFERLGVRNQIDDAFIRGADVEISAETFAGVLQSDEQFTALADHVRVSPESMTAEEARAFEASGIEEALDAVHKAARPKEVRPDDEVGSREATPEGAATTPITLAEEELGLGAFFKSAEEAGMTPAQYESYLAAVARAAEVPKLRAEERRLRQEQRELSSEWREKREAEQSIAEAHLSNEPVFQALNAIGPMQLDRASVIAALPDGERQLAELPRSQRGAIFTAEGKKDGIDADAHAQLYGFTDATEMLFAMLDRGSFAEAVQRQTDSAMRAKHTEILTRADEIKAAIADLHNDKTLNVLTEELNALREARAEKRLSQKLVTQAARDQLQDHKIEDIEANLFLNAAKRAARAAGKLLRKGDRKGAARSKFQQVINFAMSQEAHKVRDELRRKRKYLSKFSKPPKRNDTLPVAYRNMIDEILSGVSLNRRLTENARNWHQMLASFVAEQRDKGVLIKGMPREVRRAQARLDEDARTNVQEMTLAEFREMHATVRALEKAGREENKLAKQEEQQTRQEIVDELVELVQSNLPARATPDPRTSRLAALKAETRQYVSLLLHPDTVLRAIDGFKNLGAAYRNIKGRVDQAYYNGYQPGQVGYIRRQKQAAKDVLELFSVFTDKERAAFGKKADIPGLRQPLTRGQALSLLLNTGNEDNITALVESGKFDMADVEAVQQAATRKEWDFVQSVWDYLETYWPEVRSTTERRTNTSPQQVEARSVSTPHGEYRGGYYPLRYDSFTADPKNAESLIEEALFGGFVASHTRDGHTKARVGSGKREVLLDMYVINSHLDQVIYDLEVGDAVSDAYRILHHPDFKRAMREQGHGEKWNGLDLWLGDTIVSELHSSSPLESRIRMLRTGYTIAKLAWNFAVAALQPLGLIQTSVQIGKRDTLQGLLLFMRSLRTGKGSVFAEVQAQSVLMAQRNESFNRDIVDAKRVMNEKFAGQSKLADVVFASFFFFIQKTQQFTDTVTWLAAKRKGMFEFKGDEKMARDYADRMVIRTQASGNFHERTQLERGTWDAKHRQTELVRMWTLFVSYFMAKTNVAYEQVHKTSWKDPWAAANVATNLALLYVVETLLADLIRGYGPEDEDEDGLDMQDWARYFVPATLGTMAAGLPLARELTQEAQGFRGGGLMGSLSKDVSRVIDQLSKEEWDASLYKSLNNLAGPLVPYPSSQVNKTVEGVAGWFGENDFNIFDAVMGPPRN